MSTTHPNDIFETGRNNLKPLLVALAIFAAAVVVSVLITGLPG
jgi:hypothetical protein